MARISLEIEGLEDKITKLNHSVTRIHNILSQFNTEKNTIDKVIRERHNINYQLNKISDDLKALEKSTIHASTHIKTAINGYQDAEKELKFFLLEFEEPKQQRGPYNDLFNPYSMANASKTTIHVKASQLHDQDQDDIQIGREEEPRTFVTSCNTKSAENGDFTTHFNIDVSYHEMDAIIKQMDTQMKIAKQADKRTDWYHLEREERKRQAEKRIEELFQKLREFDKGKITQGVADGAYKETGVWEHYKKFIKKNVLIQKEQSGQQITPYDLYEYTKLSAIAEIIDDYGDTIVLEKNQDLIQSKIAESLGVNVEILENNDIKFLDKNATWKYVGQDTYDAVHNASSGSQGMRSQESARRWSNSPSVQALRDATKNKALDLSVEELQFLYGMDMHGTKDYLTGRPGYSKEENEHKKELRDALYRLLTGEDIQYFKHTWSGWEKTGEAKGNVWAEVKSNADFALEVDDIVPSDLLTIVKPTVYTVAAFYGAYTVGIFLEGVSIYGFKIAAGFAANGVLNEMITDYNSTLNATDADEQFIMKVLEGTDKDEALLEKTSNLTRQSVNDKLSRYLLNMEHPVGGSKAKWFNKALGFTQDNMDDLAKQIVFNPKQAVQTGISEFGTKFNQTISINGANGKVIDVTFAWMKSVKDDVVRLVTAIPTKK